VRIAVIFESSGSVSSVTVRPAADGLANRLSTASSFKYVFISIIPI
tara:strand:- start:4598 stop:4735 length:138 start_codon:yes stop_codon:yes gene_type:complete